MLNIIWPVFIIISIIYSIITGKVTEVNNAVFESANETVKLTITFFGTICLWNGIINIASKTSMIEKLTEKLSPIIKFLFPDLKKEKEVQKEISMNVVANMLGLGNAATPLGLKAMKSMQKININKESLSNSMAMFIVLNTASIQIIPTTVIAIRNSLGSENATAIVFPVWIATICAAISGIIAVKILIKLTQKKEDMSFINYLSTVAVPIVILIIIAYGVVEKIKVFDTFIDGVKEGIQIVIGIFPTLMGLFLAITLLRESGVLDLVVNLLTPVTNLFNIPKEIMPLAILRPISGSASMAVATDIMSQYGTDTIIGLITSTLMGSTETTLYTIAIYTGIVKIKKIRFVLIAALIGDFVGMIASVGIWRFLS